MNVSIVKTGGGGAARRGVSAIDSYGAPLTLPLHLASLARRLRQLLVKISSRIRARVNVGAASRRACILTELISELIDTRFVALGLRFICIILVRLVYDRGRRKEGVRGGDPHSLLVPVFFSASLPPVAAASTPSLSLSLFPRCPATERSLPFVLPGIKISAP